MIDERGWKQMSFNIAIDGPAGAGKSTIAKKLEKKYPLFMWIPVLCIVPLDTTFRILINSLHHFINIQLR